MHARWLRCAFMLIDAPSVSAQTPMRCFHRNWPEVSAALLLGRGRSRSDLPIGDCRGEMLPLPHTPTTTTFLPAVRRGASAPLQCTHGSNPLDDVSVIDQIAASEMHCVSAGGKAPGARAGVSARGRRQRPAQAACSWRRPGGSAMPLGITMISDVVFRSSRVEPLGGRGGPRLASRSYKFDAANVSQLLMSPEAKPALNQRERCADVPCVKESGTA